MGDAESTQGADRVKGSFVALRIAGDLTISVIWVGLMLALVALGGCDSFGGRCDGTRPPILEDDVAGGAFVGTAIAARLLCWLRHPSRRQAAVGVFVAIVAAGVVAFLARGIAHG